MIAGNKQSISVFETDVDQTYAIIKKRAVASKEERAKIAEQSGVEQIQLVARVSGTEIGCDLKARGPGRKCTQVSLRLELLQDHKIPREVMYCVSGRRDVQQDFRKGLVLL